MADEQVVTQNRLYIPRHPSIESFRRRMEKKSDEEPSYVGDSITGRRRLSSEGKLTVLNNMRTTSPIPYKKKSTGFID